MSTNFGENDQMIKSSTVYYTNTYPIFPPLTIAGNVSILTTKHFGKAALVCACGIAGAAWYYRNKISWMPQKFSIKNAHIAASTALSLPFLTKFFGLNSFTVSVAAAVSLTLIKHSIQREETVTYVSELVDSMVQGTEALKKQLQIADQIKENIERMITTQVNNNKHLAELNMTLRQNNKELEAYKEKEVGHLDRLNALLENLSTTLIQLETDGADNTTRLSHLKKQLRAYQQELTLSVQKIEKLTSQLQQDRTEAITTLE